MPAIGLAPGAHLVLDNCVLSMLAEYYCDRRVSRLPPEKRIPILKQCIAEPLNILRQFTPDGLLHCTSCVADEFKPAPVLNELPGRVQHQAYQGLKSYVCSLLHQTAVDPQAVKALRSLPAAPRKLVGPGGLSDNDLSLVVLGSQLAGRGNPVYVLSNDQALLDFISWVRTQPSARSRWRNITLLQGLRSLMYLELIHRSCQIQTDYMEDLINFFMLDHYKRKDFGGDKGVFIFQQLVEIRTSLTESVRIKLTTAGTVQ